jgi:aminopeptidase N
MQTKLKGMRRWFRAGFIALVACGVAAGVLPRGAAAQDQGPIEHRRELARKKAERFEKLRLAETRQTESQTGYDVSFYSLDLSIDPSAETISGAVEISGSVTAAFLSTVDIDLDDNMTVSAVTWTGGTLSFTHPEDLLVVTLDRTYTQGELFSFTVHYSGTPDPSYGAFGFDTHNGDPMIWSLSEPFGARCWWPCKDVPSDKADSVDVRITVPEALVVASNGTLLSETDNGATKTYYWRERYPISTYLVSVAIHPYVVYSDWYRYAPSDSMEIKFFVFPDHYSAVQPTYAMTKDMITVFADLFGEYPFLDEKYGHAEFTWGGGMEHQTITSLGSWNEYLIAHELAHQWWGDMVTCDDFHHVWLNEGFATYSEALWSEAVYGVAQYQEDMENAQYFGPGTIYVPNTDDWNRIFHSGLSYNKGSWVLHMLRHVVRDSDFFEILRTYYADSRYQYATVTTEQFRDLCEEVSGMELDWFFHEWIYEERYPMYSYDWTFSPNGGLYNVALTLRQLQTNFTFTMPVDVTITTTAGDTTVVVWNDLPLQEFTLTVQGEPTAVALDKDQWILRTIEEPIQHPTFHRGVLVVNGVDLSYYGSEIWSAYQDSVFWGSYDIGFWDCFEETPLGYPANVPAPLGHGRVPPDTLQQFSAVVWVGNNFNGDLARWNETSIFSYLEAGGNVLLLSRLGQDFVDAPLRQYLGITWRESSSVTLNSCVAVGANLIGMSRIGSQSTCAVFDTSLATNESKLLFKETGSFSTHRGIGVIRQPAAGGTHRPEGGKFAFVSGRPYRWQHAQLRTNVETILGSFFYEPYVSTHVPGNAPSAPSFALEQNHPNPFNPETTIRFTLDAKSRATLRVYDVSGRLVATIVSAQLPAGPHRAVWDGKNQSGESVASGVYFYCLSAGGHTATKKMVLLR